MFMDAHPRLVFNGSDIFAFEQNVKARAQQRFNTRHHRKLMVRNGKLPLSSGSTQQPGAMESEDWSLASMPDGIQDNLEAQQLRNRYLAGTAGSPYSDPDHGIFFQRMQRFDGSLSNKRPVMDHNQPWQPFGVPDTTDIQSMFAPMQIQFDISYIDGLPMPAPGNLGQSMPAPPSVFAESDVGTSFGSFSSIGAPNLLDSCPFSSTDGAPIINSPSEPFEYAHSPFASSSLVPEDLSSIKGAPPSPPPFSEPTPLLFFPTAQHEHLVEHQRHMEGHQEALRAPVPESHGGSSGFKADPSSQHMLVARPRKELPGKPRSSRAGHGSSARRRNSPPHAFTAAAPKPEVRPSQPKPCPTQVSQPDPAERSAKDEYLLKAKREGLTYREIRVKGNFTEAESTLRGRYRTLTKSKEERVRKPEWSEKDVHLLQKAVRKFAKGNDPTSMKIPWKQVAEYIQRNGGSYLFGNATCRKKWDELVLAASGRQMGGLGAPK